MRAGERVVITGANGAGKSTLLGLLLGTQTPDEGEVRVGSAVELTNICGFKVICTCITALVTSAKIAPRKSWLFFTNGISSTNRTGELADDEIVVGANITLLLMLP